ncbi:MAG: FIST C-terminal domain-containing protein [Granulosicoccus sp.]|nr:FIST C-terminal domain-containing protein [Granulosicoccus sp.]
MNTQIGIGSSNQTNSVLAGEHATSLALEDAPFSDPDFALVFCGGKHDPVKFLQGVNKLIPDVKKAGGSSFGIISGDFVGYDGFEVGVTLFKSSTMTFDICAVGELNQDEYKTGRQLGTALAKLCDGNEKGMLLFYDSSKQQNPPMLNFVTPLFAGLSDFLPENLVCAGGGLLADMTLSTCYQIVNDQVLTQHAVAVLISGECKVETSILHGCKPCSDYITITKVEGPVILEIDDRPAIDVIDELLGKSLSPKEYAMNVTLGVNRGEKFDDFKESNYANRLTLAVDEETKSLIMFEPDLKVGDEVQLMRRDFDADYIGQVVQDLVERFEKSDIVSSFYINCGGRAKPFSGVNFEDALEVRGALGSNVPFSGFYSGVEVAKVGDQIQPLDWTGVLVMIGE